MTYKVIGLMSGSSLDGLDIAYVHLTEQRGTWSFELKEAGCVPYCEDWLKRLKNVSKFDTAAFLSTDASYGKLIGEYVQTFRKKHGLEYGIDFISSHGHTIFHEPALGYTCQIGSGAEIAACTGLSVISDLRAMDVALGGQGAPIVPIGDKLLFGEYDYWLNLGGIANITLKSKDTLRAFDICACNQILNGLANREGLEYDKGGELGMMGTVIPDLLVQLNHQPFYQLPPPKSLSNDMALQLGGIAIDNRDLSTEDLLATYCKHIAEQIANAINEYQNSASAKLLATGGGALNTFLIQMIRQELMAHGIEVIVPAQGIIEYKEAIIMALIGALRWRNEVNVLASVTGAVRDSVGGVIWTVA